MTTILFEYEFSEWINDHGFDSRCPEIAPLSTNNKRG